MDNKDVTSNSVKDPQQFDGRKPGEWESVYCDQAWKKIKWECWYIGVLLFGSLLFCLINWTAIIQVKLGFPKVDYDSLSPYLYAFSAGIIGGSLFTMKWLYHSVATQKWHADRFLWRFFTPWISGSFALVMYIMMTSGLLSAFDAKAISSGPAAFSIGFLVGYFSDSAMSKFREIADILFGTSSSKK